MAEVKISVLTEQVLDRRLGSQVTVQAKPVPGNLNGKLPGQLSTGVSQSLKLCVNAEEIASARRRTRIDHSSPTPPIIYTQGIRYTDSVSSPKRSGSGVYGY